MPTSDNAEFVRRAAAAQAAFDSMPADPPAALTALEPTAEAVHEGWHCILVGGHRGDGRHTLSGCTPAGQGDAREEARRIWDHLLALPASERDAFAAALSAGTVEPPPGQAPAHDEEPR